MNLLRPVKVLRSSKTFKGVLDQIRRVTRLGNYWYWLKPSELKAGVDIASIICPLRYDVLVRQEFFTFYAAHRELYHSSFPTFVILAKQSSYYTWYMESEAVRCHRDLLSNGEVLEAKFVDRVRKSADLYESVKVHGFTQQFPIILKTAEHLLPPTTDKLGPPTGKTVSARYFMADGCHRLALLMAMGHTTLPATHFRIKCFREFSPFDSTSLLAPTLPIAPAAYFAFLSSKYCAPHVFESRDNFLEYVRTRKPEFLEEVLSVMRVDGFEGNPSIGNDKLAVPLVSDNLEK